MKWYIKARGNRGHIVLPPCAFFITATNRNKNSLTRGAKSSAFEYCKKRKFWSMLSEVKSSFLLSHTTYGYEFHINLCLSNESVSPVRRDRGYIYHRALTVW